MTYETEEEEGNYKSPTDVKVTLSIIGIGLAILLVVILVGM